MKPITYFWEIRGTACEVCGLRPAVHRHHCLYHRKKGHPELDEEYNIQIVCIKCHLHEGTPDGHEERVKFWHKQCERYGKDTMIEWHNSVRLKKKEYAYK